MDYAAVSADIAEKLTSFSLSRGSNSAELLGLEEVVGVGQFAMAVGSPKGMPDVVVKVCDDEPYRAYIEAVYSGELYGPHVPVVYSLTEVEGKLVVVMERLVPLNDTIEELDMFDTFIESEAFNPFAVWIFSTPFKDDMHTGNLMMRPSTGDLVVIDPVW